MAKRMHNQVRALLLFLLMGYSALKRTRSGRSAASGYSSRQDPLGRTGSDVPIWEYDELPTLSAFPRSFNGVSSEAFWVADGAGSMTAEAGEALSTVGTGDSWVEKYSSLPTLLTNPIPTKATYNGAGYFYLTNGGTPSREWNTPISAADGAGNYNAPKAYVNIADIGADLSSVLRVTGRCSGANDSVDSGHGVGIAMYGPTDVDALKIVSVSEQIASYPFNVPGDAMYAFAEENGTNNTVGTIGPPNGQLPPHVMRLYWNGTDSAFVIPDSGFSSWSVAANTVSYWGTFDDGTTWQRIGDRAIAAGVAPTKICIWPLMEAVFSAAYNSLFTNLEVMQAPTAPTDEGSYHPLEASDSATKFNGEGLETATAGFCDLGTDDAVISALVRVPESGVAEYWLSKSDAGNEVINCGFTAAGELYGVVAKGVTSVAATSAALLPGCWYFVELYIEAGVTMRWHVNGAVSGAAADISAIGDLDSAGKWTIGTTSGTYDDDFTGAMCFASVTHGAALLDTVTPLTEHVDRFAKINGTYTDGTAPTVSTRSSSKHLIRDTADGTRNFVRVGENWPSIDCIHVDGTLYHVVSEEGAVTTGAADSEDLNGSSWTHVALTYAGLSNTQKGPFGRHVSEIISTAVDTDHYAHESGGSGSDHVMGFIIAAGDKTRAKLVSTATPNIWIYATGLDTASATIEATDGSQVTSSNITYLGQHGGKHWHYVQMYYTVGAAGAHTHYVQPVAAAADNFAGDAETVDLYVAHYQHESGNTTGQLTSPIYASGGASTRAEGVLRYSSTGKVDSQIRLEFDLVPLTPHSITIDADTYGIHISDGSANNFAAVRLLAVTGGKAYPQCVTGGSTQVTGLSSAASLMDGDVHSIAVDFIDNATEFWVDGLSRGVDSSCSMPFGAVDRIDLCNDYNGGASSDHFGIANLKVYRR